MYLRRLTFGYSNWSRQHNIDGSYYEGSNNIKGRHNHSLSQPKEIKNFSSFNSEKINFRSLNKFNIYKIVSLTGNCKKSLKPLPKSCWEKEKRSIWI